MENGFYLIFGLVHKIKILKNNHLSLQREMNKKGSVMMLAAVLLLGAIILVGLASNLALRECNNNSECPDDHYCSSNHECRPYPEEVVVRNNYNLLAAIVLGASMITAAVIWKKKGKNDNSKDS